MYNELQSLYESLEQRASRYGIIVSLAQLKDEVSGEFDGPTINVNENCKATERAFYLAHAIGSIAEWSLHFDRSNDTVQELRRAKKERGSERFDCALNDYLAFEQRTWDSAVWLLKDTGYTSFTSEFTSFGRADLAAMRIFHTTGKAPVWRDFWSAWTEAVRTGEQHVTPFCERAIQDFRAVKIPKQEIVQEDD